MVLGASPDSKAHLLQGIRGGAEVSEVPESTVLYFIRG